MYFSLRTETNEHKQQVKNILENLPKIFGEDKIERVKDYENFVAINLKDLYGFFSYVYQVGGSVKYRLYIYDHEHPEKNISIWVDLIETIYSLI